MRRAVSLVVSLAALVVLVWWVQAVRSSRAAADAVPAPQSAPRPEPVADRLSAPRPAERAPDGLPTAPAREVIAVIAAPSAGEPSRGEDACVVVGRVVDESVAPLAEVEVRIGAYRAWAEGHAVPRLPGPRDLYGWIAATDPEGRFRFEAPLPTAPSIWLEIDPDPFHDSLRIVFGGERRGARPPLAEGELDLGTMTLATTGAIRGRVLDHEGRPIAGAELVVGTDRSSTIDRRATSDSAGAFTIGHVPAGTYGVNAEHEGHLSEFRTPLAIERERITQAGDFLLRDAPVLAGVVVDPSGAPIANARLWGWPSSHGAGAGTRSAADGTFTIHLPQDEPYSLGAECEGYEPVSQHDRSTQYPPDTTDLRIVMEPAATLAIRVVDAETGEPIERFGYTVLVDNSWYGSVHVYTTGFGKPAIHEAPDGRARAAFRVGQDVVVVVAPGYGPNRVDIDPSAPVDDPYVVRLARNASVSGIVLMSGLAAEGAIVRLEVGFLGQDPGESQPRFSVDRDRSTTERANSSGAFCFEDVGPGTYRLLATSATGSARRLDPFAVGSGETLDLGRLELQAPASVTGRVLLPPGRVLAGRRVQLDDSFDRPSAVTDAGGRFRFEGVPPGRHELRLLAVPGEFAASDDVVLDLALGETREVVLDVRERGTCELRLTILFGTGPVEGLMIHLDGPGPPRGRRISLGPTADDGSARGSVPVASEYRVRIARHDLPSLEHPSARIAAVLDGHVDETIVYELGSVEIDWPRTVPLPEKGSIAVAFRDPSHDSRDAETWRVPFWAGPSSSTFASVDPHARRVRLECVPIGERELEFEILSAEAPRRVTLADGSYRHERPTLYRATAPVHVFPQTTARIRLD
jgi:hypothetical protein